MTENPSPKNTSSGDPAPAIDSLTSATASNHQEYEETYLDTDPGNTPKRDLNDEFDNLSAEPHARELYRRYLEARTRYRTGDSDDSGRHRSQEGES
ncbi:hypothetical protein FOPE_10909 [Fonsecaea pedrosoi]|nr:hypothetical protein FOPE_10909 [Fonsecaea pedrosoi]